MIKKVEKEEAAPVEGAAVDETGYITLRKPINIAGTVLTRILVDPSDLSGKEYYELVTRFRKEFPELYRGSFNLLQDDTFVMMVLAKLNPPMTMQDCMQIPFKELSLIRLVIHAKNFSYADPAPQNPD